MGPLPGVALAGASGTGIIDGFHSGVPIAYEHEPH